MATSTPWGASQQSERYARGIVSYSTASHGGFHLSKSRVAEMPEALRRFVSIEKDGGVWLEEDIEWAFAALAFPGCFESAHVKSAEKSLRNWNPDAWEAFYGRALQAGESSERDRTNFFKANAHVLLVICAWGSWAEHVPEGKVGVLATPGGQRNQDGSYWLVDQSEYNAERPATEFAFSIDPARHQKLDVCLGAHKSRMAA